MLSHFLIIVFPDKTLFPPVRSVTPTSLLLPLLLLCWCVGFSHQVRSNQGIGVDLPPDTNNSSMTRKGQKGVNKLDNILYHVPSTTNTIALTTDTKIITSQTTTIDTVSQPNSTHTSLGENSTHIFSSGNNGTYNLPTEKRITGTKEEGEVSTKKKHTFADDSSGFISRGSEIVPPGEKLKDKQITEPHHPSSENHTDILQKDDVHIKIIDTDARNRRDRNPFRRKWSRKNRGRYWRWRERSRRRRWRHRSNMTTPAPNPPLVDKDTGDRRVVITQPGQRPDRRPDHRPDRRPDHRPDYRPDHRPDHRPEHRPDHRPEHRPRPEQNQTDGSTSISGHGVFSYWNVPPFVLEMRRKLEQKIRQMSYILYNGLSDTLYDISRRSKYLIRKYSAIKEDAKNLISDTYDTTEDIVSMSNNIYDTVLYISAFNRRLFERVYDHGHVPTAGSLPDISDFSKRDYNEFNRDTWLALRTAKHMRNKFFQLNHTYAKHYTYLYNRLDVMRDLVAKQRIRVGDLMDIAQYVNNQMSNLTKLTVPKNLREIYDEKHLLVTDNYQSRHRLFISEQLHQDVTTSQKSCYRRLQDLSELNYTRLKNIPRPTIKPLDLKEKRKLHLMVNRAERHTENILRTAAEIDRLLPPLIKSGKDLILKLSMQSQSDSPEVRILEKMLRKWGKLAIAGKSMNKKWMKMRRRRIIRMRKRMPKKLKRLLRHRRSAYNLEEDDADEVYDEIIKMLTEIIKKLDDMWMELFQVSPGNKCEQIDAEGSGGDDTELECEMQGSGGKMGITDSESGTNTRISGNDDDDDSNDFEFTDVKRLVVSSHHDHLQSIISSSLSQSKSQHKTSRNLLQDVEDIKSSLNAMEKKKRKLESDVTESVEIVNRYQASVKNATEMRRLLNETEEKINVSQKKCSAAQKLADLVLADKDELERLLEEKKKAKGKKEKKEIQEDYENVKRKGKKKKTNDNESEKKKRKDKEDKKVEIDISKKLMEENEKTKAELRILIEKYLQLQKKDEEREEEERKEQKVSNDEKGDAEDTKKRKTKKHRRKNQNQNRSNRDDREKKNSKKNTPSDAREERKRKRKKKLEEMRKRIQEVNEKRKKKIGRRKKENDESHQKKGEEADVKKNKKRKSTTDNRKKEKNENQMTDKNTALGTNEKGSEIDVGSVLEIKKNLEDVLKKLNQRLVKSKKQSRRHRRKRKRKRPTKKRNQKPSMDGVAFGDKEMIESKELAEKDERGNENEDRRKKKTKKSKNKVKDPKEELEEKDEMKNEELNNKKESRDKNEDKRKKRRKKSKNDVKDSKKDSREEEEEEEESKDKKKSKKSNDKDKSGNENKNRQKDRREKAKNDVKDRKEDVDEREGNNKRKKEKSNDKDEKGNENEDRKKKKRKKSKSEVENPKEDLNEEEENDEQDPNDKKKRKKKKVKNEVKDPKKDVDEEEEEEETDEQSEKTNQERRKKKRRKSKSEVKNSKDKSNDEERNDKMKNKALNDKEESENENEGGRKKKKRKKPKNGVKDSKKDEDEEDDEMKSRLLNDKEETGKENRRKKKRKKVKNEAEDTKKDVDEEGENDKVKSKDLNNKEKSRNENDGRKKKKKRKKSLNEDLDEKDKTDELKDKELNDKESPKANRGGRKKNRKKSKNLVKDLKEDLDEEEEGNDEMKKKRKKERNGKKQTKEEGLKNNGREKKSRKKDINEEKDERELKKKEKKDSEKNDKPKKKRKKDKNEENDVKEEEEKNLKERDQNDGVKRKKEKKDKDGKNEKKKGRRKNIKEKEKNNREEEMKDTNAENSDNNVKKKKNRKKGDISTTMKMSLLDEGKVISDSSRRRKIHRKRKRILKKKIQNRQFHIQNEQSLAEEMKNNSKQIEEDVSKSKTAVESIVKDLKKFSPDPCTSITKNVKQLRLNVSQIRQKIQLARTIVSSMEIPVSLNGKNHLEVMLDPKDESREIQTSVEICLKPKTTNSIILGLQANNSISYSLALVDSKPLLTILDAKGETLQKLEADTKLIPDNWYQLLIHRMGRNFSLSVNPTGSKSKGVTVQKVIPDFKPVQIPLSLASLGGYPENFPISDSKKLKGCIAYLNVNGHSTHILSPFKSGAYPPVCKNGCDSVTNTSMVFEGNGFALLEHDGIFDETFTSVHLTFKTLQKNALLLAIKKNTELLLLVTLIEGNIQVESPVQFVCKQSQDINFSDGQAHKIQVTLIDDELEIKTSAEKVKFEDKTASGDETLFEEGISLGGLVSNLTSQSKYMSLTGCLSNISIDNKLVDLLYLKNGRHVYQGDCQENAWLSCSRFTESSTPITLPKYDHVKSISLMISAQAQGVALFFERDAKFSIKVQLTTDSLEVFNYENDESKTIPKKNGTELWHLLHIEDQKANIQITLDGEQTVDVAYKENTAGWFGTSNADDFPMVITVGGLPKDRQSSKKSDTLIGSISTLSVQFLPLNLQREFGSSNSLSVCAKPTVESLTNTLDCSKYTGR